MGQAHTNHHYVPAFLLRRWESGPCGKLRAYRFEGDLFLCSERKATSVASQDHLYSTNQAGSQPDVSLERDYLGPKIDDKAAVALAALERGGLPALSKEMREDWTRFLTAQIFRSPARNGMMRQISKVFMADRIRDEFGATDEPLDKQLLPSASELSDAAMKAFPNAVEASKLQDRLAQNPWALLRFEAVDDELLIGDEPVMFGDQGDKGFILAMPLGPKLLFLCGSAVMLESLEEAQSTTLLRMNEEMIEQTDRSVYAASARNAKLIESRLGAGSGEVD